MSNELSAIKGNLEQGNMVFLDVVDIGPFDCSPFCWVNFIHTVLLIIKDHFFQSVTISTIRCCGATEAGFTMDAIIQAWPEQRSSTSCQGTQVFFN